MESQKQPKKKWKYENPIPDPNKQRQETEESRTSQKKVKFEEAPQYEPDEPQEAYDFEGELKKLRMERNLSLIMGPPKSGKTTLVNWLCVVGARKGRWDFIHVHSVTAHNGNRGNISKLNIFLGDYDYLLNREHVVTQDALFAENIRKLMEDQQTLMKQARAQNVKPPVGLLVIDDPLGSVNWNNPVYTKLFSTYRNFLLDVFVVTQYIVALPKAVYTYAGVYYIFKMGQDDDYKHIYSRILSAYKSQTGISRWDGVQNLLENLQPHTFLVVNTNKTAQRNVGTSQTDPLETFIHETIDC